MQAQSLKTVALAGALAAMLALGAQPAAAQKTIRLVQVDADDVRCDFDREGLPAADGGRDRYARAVGLVVGRKEERRAPGKSHSGR